MVIYVKFLRVQGKVPFQEAKEGKSAQPYLESALYGHTKVAEYDDNGVTFYATLRTEAYTAEDVEYLANHQMGRLNSCLIYGDVFDSPQEVQNSSF